MENPAFLESDHPQHQSGAILNMSQRRPRHLPALHHSAHSHPRASSHSTPTTTTTPLAPIHLSHAHLPHVPPNHALYPDPALPPMYPAHMAAHALQQQQQQQAGTPTGEPLYSCQAPRGHDHVYQCPGMRAAGVGAEPVDHHHHHYAHNHRQQQQLHYQDQLEEEEQHHQLEQHQPLDHRPEYHYGGSDYSSTEPIYAQPHLYPREGGSTSSGTHTPTLGFTNPRTSLRSGRGPSPGGAITPTSNKYIVRSTGGDSSASSSTLPTVSALLDPAHHPLHHSHLTPAHLTANPLRDTSRTSRASGRSSKGAGGGGGGGGSSSPVPAKLKRQGVFRAWKVKFLRGEGGKRRFYLLAAALVFIVLLVLGALAAVLYLTLGGGLSVFVGDSPKLVEFTETGSNIVEGEFKITNQNFWSGLEDPQSEEFISMAQSIEEELDTLFSNSVWSREYNRSEVVSLAPGSLLVQARLILNRADAAAAQKLGTAFLRGLHNRRGHEWLGTFTIDITSIRFTEVMLETPAPPTVPFSSASAEPSTPVPAFSSSVSSVLEATTQSQETSRTPQRPHHLNVGWGEWGPWSTCSPCSPQYDQIRTRQCQLDGGSGLLISSIEACLHTEMTQGTSGDMEIRPCQCDFTTSTTTARTTTTTTTTSTARAPPKQGKTQEESGDESDTSVGTSVTERLCDECTAREVCVAMQDEPYPTCRSPKDAADPTGCGGLCAIDSEVCQALGSRAFRCHSASQCLEDEWRCADGLCIPMMKRCDGHMNCYDQSDENKCVNIPECGTEAFQCGNNTSCLPLTAKCDRQVDCWDGSDEVNCTNLANASHSSGSVTASKTALTDQTNPSDVLDIARPTSSDAGMGGALGVAPSVIAGTRVGTTVMNRTAIGLSSLSHRERELLS